MNFKMSGKDFEMLAKFYEKKCKGSTLQFSQNRETNLQVKVTTELGDEVTIDLYDDSTNTFPMVTKKARLGDEL